MTSRATHRGNLATLAYQLLGGSAFPAAARSAPAGGAVVNGDVTGLVLVWTASGGGMDDNDDKDK